ncbi:MAG: hypothetical protein GX567_10235, partial [Clostridia bacterium]|nr:hypothetical protein [Clostridia bacterium]
VAMTEGIEQAYTIAEQKIQEYPTDAKLISTLALTLQGAMMMTEVDAADKEKYDAKIQDMYEWVGKSGNSKYADQSNFMLASRAIMERDYARAQDLIDKLPESPVIDKQILQANLWMETGKEKEAEKIYASRILSAINQIQAPLGRLISIAVQNGDDENASQLIKCGQTLTHVFGMWEYNTYIFAFEKAIAEKNVTDTIRILGQMLDAILVPWDTGNCPIYKHIGGAKQEIDLGNKMCANILKELETSEKYQFLKEDKTFQQLIQTYQIKTATK